MNSKHPYEKHLAEKLVQLPPPDDPDQNWQRMKTLLDKNMPRGGGGSGGSYRWWITGTVIVAVVVGTWFGGKTFLTREQRNESVAGTIKTVNNKTASSVASTENNAEQPGGFADADNSAGSTAKPKTKLPGAAYASSTSPAGNDNAVAGDQPVPVTTGKANENNYGESKKDIAATNSSAKNNAITIEEAEKARSSGNNENNPRLLANNNSPAATETPSSYHSKTSPDRNKIYASDSKNNKTSAGNKHTTNNRHQPANNYTNIQANEASVVKNTTGRRVTNKKGKNPIKKAGVDENGENTAGNEEAEKHPYTYKPKITLPSQPSTGSELKASPVTYDINYTAALVVSPSGVIQREFTYYTQADLFPDMATRNKPANRKASRESTSPEDKSFAVGLSLPLGFPVGDQQAMGYNRNAGVNTLSDYIPSPHFQYHFNNKTYIQVGLQFSAPQYISPVLLYQEKLYSGGPVPSEQITSITARKLYYFNLPLTIYHSPLKNFYLGTGLQYSSLLSGIAQYEKIKRSMAGPQQEYVLENYFTRFGNDWLSHRLNGNELRLLIDMSYYWSKFTVGLQYNQAFNNYVSFQVTPTSPYTFDKNKSLQFYLRYNIWEDKKRKQPKGQSLLTLK
ncbi:hypothetical protein A3860_01180 [Niastella vici]|uniref:Outer membrane protein beta-barrel domain-containing protein n=2 Tax=Niastella vici TaxID=1703345 RepID=A0A1V9G8L6_9BACT|nr:hypothetical protein A3860_01180 [Niastella vici]